jgi:hypothetical protein
MYMKKTTSDVLKEEMGYSEEVRQCNTCGFYEEVEDVHLDRSWIDTCTFNSIGSMVIERAACCKHWKKRVKK